MPVIFTSSSLHWEIAPADCSGSFNQQFPPAVSTGCFLRQFPPAISNNSFQWQFPPAVSICNFHRQFLPAVSTGSLHRQFPLAVFIFILQSDSNFEMLKHVLYQMYEKNWMNIIKTFQDKDFSLLPSYVQSYTKIDDT